MGRAFKFNCKIIAHVVINYRQMRSQLTEYFSADGTSEAEEEPLLELGPEDVLLLFIMMQNSLQLSLLSYNHQCHVVYSLYSFLQNSKSLLSSARTYQEMNRESLNAVQTLHYSLTETFRVKNCYHGFQMSKDIYVYVCSK